MTTKDPIDDLGFYEEPDEDRKPKRGKLVCKALGHNWPGLTWTEARRSYARMVANGISPEEAKALGPLCSGCASMKLRECFGHAGYKKRRRYAFRR